MAVSIGGADRCEPQGGRCRTRTGTPSPQSGRRPVLMNPVKGTAYRARPIRSRDSFSAPNRSLRGGGDSRRLRTCRFDQTGRCQQLQRYPREEDRERPSVAADKPSGCARSPSTRRSRRGRSRGSRRWARTEPSVSTPPPSGASPSASGRRVRGRPGGPLPGVESHRVGPPSPIPGWSPRCRTSVRT